MPQLLNSEHERPPLPCHMRRRIHAQERSDAQGSRKSGKRAREREEREVLFFFVYFSLLLGDAAGAENAIVL